MIADLQVDLKAEEIVMVTMLAHFGSAVLAGAHEDAQTIADLIFRAKDAEEVADRALAKLEATLRIAKSAIESELAEG